MEPLAAIVRADKDRAADAAIALVRIGGEADPAVLVALAGRDSPSRADIVEAVAGGSPPREHLARFLAAIALEDPDRGASRRAIEKLPAAVPFVVSPIISALADDRSVVEEDSGLQPIRERALAAIARIGAPPPAPCRSSPAS